MDNNRIRTISIKNYQGKLKDSLCLYSACHMFLVVTIRNQKFITSSQSCERGKIVWKDSIKLEIEFEETIKIQCFCELENGKESILGSITVPIKFSANDGYFKNNICLMNMGKVTFYLKVDIFFENKNQRFYEFSRFPYSSPPEFYHSHAVFIHENFMFYPVGLNNIKNGRFLVN